MSKFCENIFILYVWQINKLTKKDIERLRSGDLKTRLMQEALATSSEKKIGIAYEVLPDYSFSFLIFIHVSDFWSMINCCGN